MSWHSIRGVDPLVLELRKSLEDKRFPHAFLFTGPEGVGKRTFANKLAQALLCERVPEAKLDPCEVCPACLQVKNGAHPDLLTVGRPDDKQELPIAVIRQLCADLGLSPMRGSRRVAIVDDADDMNDEAANAFLKTLEEPPVGSVLIMVGTSPEGQLDTVVSRCRVVRFRPLSEPDLAAILLEQGVASNEEEAERLAKLGDGSVSRAKGLANPSLAHFRRLLIDEIADLRGFNPSAVAVKIGAFVEEAGKENVVKRERARLLAGELAAFFRGVLWSTAGLQPPSQDPDDHKAAVDLATALPPEDVFLLAERCLDADYQIQRNAYMPLILESLMRDLGTLINHKSTG